MIPLIEAGTARTLGTCEYAGSFVRTLLPAAPRASQLSHSSATVCAQQRSRTLVQYVCRMTTAGCQTVGQTPSGAMATALIQVVRLPLFGLMARLTICTYSICSVVSCFGWCSPETFCSAAETHKSAAASQNWLACAAELHIASPVFGVGRQMVLQYC